MRFMLLLVIVLLWLLALGVRAGDAHERTLRDLDLFADDEDGVCYSDGYDAPHHTSVCDDTCR